MSELDGHSVDEAVLDSDRVGERELVKDTVPEVECEIEVVKVGEIELVEQTVAVCDFSPPPPNPNPVIIGVAEEVVETEPVRLSVNEGVRVDKGELERLG